MGGPPHRGIRLPKPLLEKLDISVAPPKHSGAVRHGLRTRKAQRKAARVEKKASHVRHRNYPKRLQDHRYAAVQEQRSLPRVAPGGADVDGFPEWPNPETDLPLDINNPTSENDADIDALDAEREQRRSHKLRRKLEEDDAAIAALERKLGMQNKQSLPQSFADDGLLDLLEGIGEGSSSKVKSKESNDDSQSWLAKKRRKALNEEIERTQSESEFSGLEDSADEQGNLASHEPESIYRASSLPRKTSQVQLQFGTAGVGASTSSGPVSELEDTQRLRRIVRGLLNRLSEPNLLALLADIERLFQNNPRQIVFAVLLDTAMDQIGGPDALSETFLVLYAGLIAAVFRTVGYDFGAEAVQRITNSLEKNLASRESDPQNEKKAINLVTVLTHLFTLRMISSELIYDFIRIFVTIISESNTQLLLRIVKSSGSQLRQEDPASLKEIVMHLQSAVARADPHDMSVRTKFMIETIMDLKNNKMKSGVNASSIALEHLTRIKKILASIDQSRVKAAEPLRISLVDLHDDTKKGHWWLAGARQRKVQVDVKALYNDAETVAGSTDAFEEAQDIQQLASEQRMNTDIRRSIFINLMSASDCQDAYQRIIGLRLRKAQEPEIPKVLLHCASTEQHYNPYYAFVADLLCSSRRMRISFQLALWDMLKRLESGNTDDNIDDPVVETSGIKPAIHLAKMFGELVSNQRLEIKLIKNMQLDDATGIMHAFLEVFFLTLCLRVQRHKRRVPLEQSLREIFQPLAADPDQSHSVRIFFETALRNSDVVSTSAEREKLSQCCDIVERLLQESEDG